MPIAILLLTAFWTAGVNQETQLPPECSERLRRADRTDLLKQIVALVTESSQLWEERGAPPFMAGAVERVFQDQGWDSETDRFMLTLFDEVRTAPAQDLLGRLDILVTGLSDRYLLDDEQAGALRERLVSGSTELLIKHGWSVMPAVADIVATRGGGEQVTAEQVANLMEVAGPALADARRELARGARAFADQLEPEQRELWLDDLAAAERRVETFDAVRRNWARGAWQASDWGMEDDPIQRSETGASGEVAQQPTAPAPAERQTQSEAGAPAAAAPDDAWSRYIREFIARYKLNDDQQQAAWRVYRQAKGQEESILRRGRAAPEPANDATTQPATVGESVCGRQTLALERLFVRMKARLEKIPTRRQRQGA